MKTDLDFTYGLALKYLQKQIWTSVSMPKTEDKKDNMQVAGHCSGRKKSLWSNCIFAYL